MKKCLIAFLLLLSCADTASAQEYTDEEVYKTTLNLVREHYIGTADIEKMAINALKALRAIDKKIMVGNDGTRVTVYYNGRVLRSKLKPQNKENIEAWSALTTDITEAVKKASAEAQKRDFEIMDTILEKAITQSLDGVSKYYPEGQSERVSGQDTPRNFLSGMQDNILYIKLGAFNKFTSEKLQKALKENKAYDGVILDLRGSPGGDFSEALKVADMFLSGGILVSEINKEKQQNYYHADEKDETEDKPLVILMDGDTTSAAEIVASALQSQSRGKIVGTRSYGKGSKQELFSLPNGAVVGITTGYFKTSADEDIEKVGIKPDICMANRDSVENMEQLINRAYEGDCPRESRAKENADMEVAKYLIKSQI